MICFPFKDGRLSARWAAIWLLLSCVFAGVPARAQTAPAFRWDCAVQLFDSSTIECQKKDQRPQPSSDIDLSLAQSYTGAVPSPSAAYNAHIPTKLFTKSADYAKGVQLKINLLWTDTGRRRIKQPDPSGLAGSAPRWIDVDYNVVWNHIVPLTFQLAQRRTPTGGLIYQGSGATLEWSADGKIFQGSVSFNLKLMDSYTDYPVTDSYFDNFRSGEVKRVDHFTQQGGWWFKLHSSAANQGVAEVTIAKEATKPATPAPTLPANTVVETGAPNGKKDNFWTSWLDVLYKEEEDDWHECVQTAQLSPRRDVFRNANQLEDFFLSKSIYNSSQLYDPSDRISDHVGERFSRYEGDKKLLVAVHYTYLNQLMTGELALLEMIASIDAALGDPPLNGKVSSGVRDYYGGTKASVKWKEQLRNCGSAVLAGRYLADMEAVFIQYHRVKIHLAILYDAARTLELEGFGGFSPEMNKLVEKAAALEKLVSQREAAYPWLKTGALADAVKADPNYTGDGHFREADGRLTLDSKTLLDFPFKTAFKKYLTAQRKLLVEQLKEFAKAERCLTTPKDALKRNQYEPGYTFSEREQADLCENFTDILRKAPGVPHWNVVTHFEDPGFPGKDLALKQLTARNYAHVAECISMKRELGEEREKLWWDAGVNTALAGLTIATMGTSSAFGQAAVTAWRTASTAQRLAMVGLWTSDVAFAVAGGIDAAEQCGGGLKDFEESLKTRENKSLAKGPTCDSKLYDLKGTSAYYNTSDCMRSLVIDGALNAIPGALAIKDMLKLTPLMVRSQIDFGRTLVNAEKAALKKLEQGFPVPGRDGATQAILGNLTVEQLKDGARGLSGAGFSRAEIEKILQSDLLRISSASAREVLQSLGVKISQSATGLTIDLGRSLSASEQRVVMGELETAGLPFEYWITPAGGSLSLDFGTVGYDLELLAFDNPEVRERLSLALSSKKLKTDLEDFGRYFSQIVTRLKEQPADMLGWLGRQPKLTDAVTNLTLQREVRFGASGLVTLKFGNGVPAEKVWLDGIAKAANIPATPLALEIAFNGVRCGLSPELAAQALAGMGFTNRHVADLMRNLQLAGRLVEPRLVTVAWWKKLVNPVKAQELAEQTRQTLKRWEIPDESQRLAGERTVLQAAAYRSVENRPNDFTYELLGGTAFPIDTQALRNVRTSNLVNASSPVWIHPEFRKILDDMTSKGYKLVVDDAMSLAGYGGAYSSALRRISLTSDAPWHIFLHEYSHLKFDEAIRRIGGFDKYVGGNWSKRDLQALANSDPMRARAIELNQKGVTQKAIDEMIATEAEIAAFHADKFSVNQIGPLLARQYGLQHVMNAVKKLGLNASAQQKLAAELAQLDLAKIDSILAAQKQLDKLPDRTQNVVRFISALSVGGTAITIIEQSGTRIIFTDPETGQRGDFIL